jgi:sugar/nucleoside kinase (ribokinase family)
VGVARSDGDGRTEAPRLILAGNANVDVLLGPVTPWPRPGTEVLAERFEWRVGGMLGNAAQALASLGVPTTLVWDVGDDVMGAWLRSALAAAGDAPRVLPGATSVTVGLGHPGGERTFVSHLGHLARSEPDALAAAIATAAPGDHLLVGGSFLLPRWRDALPGLLERARDRGVVTALDTGWPTEGWSDGVRAELAAALAHVDLYLPNLDEARGLTGLTEADAATVALALEALVAGTSVIKLGADGAAHREGDRLHVAAAPRVEPVDTVGAGDTFDAALLAGRLAGWGWRRAVIAAVAMASLTITTAPRRYPTAADLARAAVPEPDALTRS